MLEAFVLGFWIIWSSDREVYPLSESLWFTLIAVILRQLTAFDLPIIDTYWMISGIGYFQLLQHLPDWLSKFLA